ncbi:hypothetical protein [Desulfosporosinus nitroreducens]|nr:hypothetical protein [Desulfosporosinus nitroreducens]
MAKRTGIELALLQRPSVKKVIFLILKKGVVRSVQKKRSQGLNVA